MMYRPWNINCYFFSQCQEKYTLQYFASTLWCEKEIILNDNQRNRKELNWKNWVIFLDWKKREKKLRSICEWKLSASGGGIISEGAQSICDGSYPQKEVHMIFIILSGEKWEVNVEQTKKK